LTHRAIIATLVAIIALNTSALAQVNEPQFCHGLVETSFVENLVPGCELGDTLVMQVMSGVAPGPVVGELCDLRHEVWTELREGHTTIVCIYQKKRKRPLGKEQ
jgi:hypothetical protein